MAISSMNIEDYVNLVGQYNNTRLGNTIDPRLLERGYTDEQIELMRSKMKRTIKEAQSLNIKFTRPLEDFKYPFFGYLLTLYNRYSIGILPFSGGLADQPAQIVELFNTLESLELEFKQQEADQEQRRAKRKKR